MGVLHGEEIRNYQEPLLDVFRDGYASNYIGDARFLNDYIGPAHVAIVDDRSSLLSGAVLVKNSRITAIATRTDREKYGSRFRGLVGLLQFTHLVDNESWISIGVKAKRTVKIAAAEAGMSRSGDETQLRKRLNRSGKIDYYSIRSDISGLLICLTGSIHGENYWQEVWDWNEI